MNFEIRKSNKAKLVRSLFGSIKRDNFKRFEELVNEHSWLFDFKNNKRENILFYAFENDSKKIIDFIIEKKPFLLKEKNILNINIVHELIAKNHSIDYFLEKLDLWSEQEKKFLFSNSDPQGNNLLLIAAKSGEKEILEKIIQVCPDFSSYQKHSNFYGQNLAHLMATNIKTDYSDISDKLSHELMVQLDNINGFSPLMLSAYHQNDKNFISFFKLSPQNQTSFLDNQLIHFAANNQNTRVIEFLIENDLCSNNLNKYGKTAINIAFSKGYENIARKIFEHNNQINKDDFVMSAKIADKDVDLFDKILNSKIQKELSQEDRNKFLEMLFLHGKYSAITQVKENKNTECFFNENINFSNLFTKTVIGKKDMINKIDLLLESKTELNKDEVKSVFKALEKLPSNQILSIVKKSTLLSKIKKEDNVALIALSLAKGISPYLVSNTLSLPINDELQSIIKQALKNTKHIEEEKHLENVEYWLGLFKDKQIVLKHYGMIASKSETPFHFIDEKFNFLPKEYKKDLVYYTITALFKKNDEISDDSIKIIEQYPSLLSNVYSGIIKVGKIPCNKKLIDILTKIEKPIISSNELGSFFNKTNDNQQQAINVIKETINLFDFKEINNVPEFCQLLISNPFHQEILDLIIEKIQDKDIFIESYLNNVTNLNNTEKIVKLISQHSNRDEIAKKITLEAINNDDFNNIELLKSLSNINFTKEDISRLAQSFIDESNYFACIKLQKCFESKFDINKLDLTKINWDKIELNCSTMNKDESFFDFLSINQVKITEKNLENMNNKFMLQIRDKNISFTTIDKYLHSLNNSIHKIEPYAMFEICSYVLERQFLNNPMAQFLSQKTFESIFDLVAKSTKGDLFEKLQNHKHYQIIDITSRVIMDKEILESDLKIKPSKNKKFNKI